MSEFIREFGEDLSPITIGKLNKSTGEWTELHKTLGFLENISDKRIWTAERNELVFTHRAYLPLEDEDGNSINLDSTMYIVQSRDFNYSEDDDTLFQVQGRMPFPDFYQYAMVRAVDY